MRNIHLCLACFRACFDLPPCCCCCLLPQPRFFYIWVGDETKCHVHSLSGPLNHIRSTLLSLDSTDGFPHSSSKWPMWFALVRLCSATCSTLHRFLHPSAFYHTTCLIMFEVPTLEIRIRPIATDASANQSHIVQVCPKCLFQFATPQHLHDHFDIYSWRSNNWSNPIMYVLPRPFPRKMHLILWLRNASKSTPSFAMLLEVFATAIHEPCWDRLQLNNGSAQLVLAPRPLQQWSSN